MKVFILLLVLSCICFAQDTIYKTDGTEIKSKVIEITNDLIKYKKFSNLDGPSYTIAKAEVFMIVYQNGEREVFKKNEEQNPPTQIQREEPQITPQPRQEQPPLFQQSSVHSNAQSRSVTGGYIGFAIGLNSSKPTSTDITINGKTNSADIDAEQESGFLFTGNVTFQSSENFGFVIGGSVDSYKNGYMNPYYIGVNAYLNDNNFVPYFFVRAGYALGKVNDPTDDENKIDAKGLFLYGGLGSKIYISNTWGLTAEIGMKYQQSNVEYSYKYGTTKYDVKSVQNVSGISLAIGFFAYL